jgi:hypothetical protein
MEGGADSRAQGGVKVMMLFDRAVSIGHRAGPNEAYRLIIGWGSVPMR